jgi:hypothetical protein
MNGLQGKIVCDIIEERRRQELLKEQGRFEFSCADDAMSNHECFTVLGEEVGEVAKECLTQSEHRLARDTMGTVAGLRKELVQVAAVVVAWLERLDAPAVVDPDTGVSLGAVPQ